MDSKGQKFKNKERKKDQMSTFGVSKIIAQTPNSVAQGLFHSQCSLMFNSHWL